jgi:hypothetical protein
MSHDSLIKEMVNGPRLSRNLVTCLELVDLAHEPERRT